MRKVIAIKKKRVTIQHSSQRPLSWCSSHLCNIFNLCGLCDNFYGTSGVILIFMVILLLLLCPRWTFCFHDPWCSSRSNHTKRLHSPMFLFWILLKDFLQLNLCMYTKTKYMLNTSWFYIIYILWTHVLFTKNE